MLLYYSTCSSWSLEGSEELPGGQNKEQQETSEIIQFSILLIYQLTFLSFNNFVSLTYLSLVSLVEVLQTEFLGTKVDQCLDCVALRLTAI